MKARGTRDNYSIGDFMPRVTKGKALLSTQQSTSRISTKTDKAITPRRSIDELVRKVAETAIELNREALKELEKH